MANSKDVVVTGVSTGIGWGTTKVLVSKGFRVFGSVRKQGDADRLQREFGNGFVPLMMDITDADAVHQAAQKVGSMIGDRNLVGLVNNAGIVVSGPPVVDKLGCGRKRLRSNMLRKKSVRAPRGLKTSLRMMPLSQRSKRCATRNQTSSAACQRKRLICWLSYNGQLV